MSSNGTAKGDGDITKKVKKVIFLTDSEYGQANVILAVAYEMLLLQQHEVHVASFAPLQARIKDLNELVPDNHVPATFHTVFGPSALEALVAKNEFIGPYRPGIRGALDTYRVTLPVLATAWDGPAYMKGYESCLEILRSVEPDLIIIEPLFSQGLEACKALSRDCVVLSPNTFQEMCGSEQPILSRLCRYPASVSQNNSRLQNRITNLCRISSAFPYPVPWYLVPANIYLKFMLIWTLVRSPTVKQFMNYRKSQNLPGLPAAFNIYHKTNHYLVQSVPETDYPCSIPPNVTGCGPILLPASPVSQDDPNLQSWLERGPTVLINLGTHIRMSDSMAREFATGLKMVLDRKPDLQILWKLKTSGGLALPYDNAKSEKMKSGFQGEGINKESLDAISPEISSDRVKIMEWMSVSPLAVLQTGRIVCSVHHGGSNSFHEALR